MLQRCRSPATVVWRAIWGVVGRIRQARGTEPLRRGQVAWEPGIRWDMWRVLHRRRQAMVAPVDGTCPRTPPPRPTQHSHQQGLQVLRVLRLRAGPLLGPRPGRLGRRRRRKASVVAAQVRWVARAGRCRRTLDRFLRTLHAGRCRRTLGRCRCTLHAGRCRHTLGRCRRTLRAG